MSSKSEQKTTSEKNEKEKTSVQDNQISSTVNDNKIVQINAGQIYSDIQNKLNKAQSTNQSSLSPVTAHWQKAVKPRFEIELYEEVTNDETGEISGYKKVPSEHPIIIEAANKHDLDEHAARYKFCHQQMKIIRKIDDGQPIAFQQQASQDMQPVPSSSQHCSSQSSIQAEQLKQKPRFYKIGDIEIKDDNGKIYQKQWVKLSDSEMSNLRVINDKNNSIVNLNGKHIEMKKWIQVEKTEDEVSSLEEGLH